LTENKDFLFSLKRNGCCILSGSHSFLSSEAGDKKISPETGSEKDSIQSFSKLAFSQFSAE